MDDVDREKITSKMSKLVIRTQWSKNLEDSLVSRGVFRPKMIDLIKADSRDEESKIRQLYLDVQRRGPKAFGNLILALVDSKNHVAANLLDQSIEIPTLPSPIAEDKHNKVWNMPAYNLEDSEAEIPPPSNVPVVDDKTPLVIKVKKADRFRGPSLKRGCYPMRSKPRGQCLIIDNEKFCNDILPHREGSIIDSNNLDILFTELGFNVTLRRNMNYQSMMATIERFSTMPEHKSADMCVVIILSHGDGNGIVFAADGRELQTEFLFGQFNNKACPNLKGKPKFFILQACRGDLPDYGTIPTLEMQSSEIDATDAKGFRGSPQPRTNYVKEPTWEDIIILYATIPGYVANRNLYRGTWLVECLCHVFMNNACDTDLREMLDLVAERLRNYETENGSKQSCCYDNRHFTKKLYFNPGIHKTDDEL